jgi:hypothetical protein
MSEVAKTRVADIDSKSSLSRVAKMDNSRRQAVLSPGAAGYQGEQ